MSSRELSCWAGFWTDVNANGDDASTPTDDVTSMSTHFVTVEKGLKADVTFGQMGASDN